MVEIICLKIFLILSSFALLTQSCGITTHIEIGERAATLFDKTSHGVNYAQLIRKHAGSFQAGSVFPDSFYSNICFRGSYNYVSEDTHWTPFVNATVNYIRRNYRRPWNTAGEQLVAFLLGVVSHQVADVLWHSLDINQGFLETMAMMNFHGKFSAAHTVGDFGGDVINSYSLDNSYQSLIKNWYVPYNDLQNIYRELYGRDVIPTYVIRICSFQMYLGRFGEQLGVIDSLYPAYSRKSPFLLDRLYSYFLGGVTDMAASTALTWNRTITMLNHGTEMCTLPKNPIFIRCYDEDSMMKLRSDAGASVRYPRNVREASSHQTPTHRSQIRINESFRKKINKSNKRKARKTKEKWDVSPLVNYSLITSTQPYSELGYYTVVGDINLDGFADILISAPSYSVGTQMYIGKVFAILGPTDSLTNMNTTIEQISTFSLTGLHNGGRFGESTAILDLNLDGEADIVVSSPSVGRDRLAYNGRVYIYLSDRGSLPSKPHVIVECQEYHCNFGTKLGSEDINGDGFMDLIIGSPMAPSNGIQRGMVQVLYSDRSIGSKKIMTNNDMNLTLHGNQDFEWFGYSFAFKNIYGKKLLAIGAPGFRKCYRSDCSYNDEDKQTTGKVYMFDLQSSSSSHAVRSRRTTSMTVEGSQAFQQFGSFVNFISSQNDTFTLAVSSSSANSTFMNNEVKQSGRVDFFKLLSLEKCLTLAPSEPLSRFGQYVIDSPNSNKIYITAPLLSKSYFEKRDIGAVFIYNKNSLIKAWKTISLMDDYARFGCSISLLISPQNSSFLQTKTQLIVGAAHYTSNSIRHSGAVVIANL